jgi:tartrate-resistant acid phosphatase type 5
VVHAAVLGNHDYRGNALAQLSPVLRKLDSRWVCKKNFAVNSGEHANAKCFISCRILYKQWRSQKK